MRLFFKAFDSKMASREKLFKAAAEFANQVGRERLLTLSHSKDRDNIVITIWYWSEEEIKPKVAAPGSHKPVIERAAAPRSPSDLPVGLSGGFAALKVPSEDAAHALERTPSVPPPAME